LAGGQRGQRPLCRARDRVSSGTQFRQGAAHRIKGQQSLPSKQSSVDKQKCRAVKTLLPAGTGNSERSERFSVFLAPKRGAPVGRLLSVVGRLYGLRRCRKVQRRLSFRGAGRCVRGVAPPRPSAETSHLLTPEFGGFSVAPEPLRVLAVVYLSSVRPATLHIVSAASSP